jgi:hypothetical protein
MIAVSPSGRWPPSTVAHRPNALRQTTVAFSRLSSQSHWFKSCRPDCFQKEALRRERRRAFLFAGNALWLILGPPLNSTSRVAFSCRRDYLSQSLANLRVAEFKSGRQSGVGRLLRRLLGPTRSKNAFTRIVGLGKRRRNSAPRAFNSRSHRVAP